MATETPYLFKPGLHSRNVSRHTIPKSGKGERRIGTLRFFFLLAGLTCLGYYSYTLADEKIYQVYENWAFDQEIAGRHAVNFRDYVREQTPFGFLAGEKEAAVPEPPPKLSAPDLIPVNGSVIGRVAIGRLNLSAVVRQGVDDKTLSQAVGHVPSTALPGQAGNFAIAAHRDTLFRALKDIRRGDVVTFQSPTGLFNYEVVATKIVKPTDVSVLRPDGGGLVDTSNEAAPDKLLTMITCYPFYFVGAAPNRFVVEARLVNSN